jgi:type I restriction enzyme R subunit
MVKLPQRITDIAAEVADHFVKHVRPNRFKAMLVCYNKETIALYKTALDALLGPETSVAIFSDVNQGSASMWTWTRSRRNFRPMCSMRTT